MNHIIKSVFIVSLCLCPVISSCTKEEYAHDKLTAPRGNNFRISAEQAQKNALEFINSLNGTTRSKLTDIKISSVKAISASKRFTRSEINDSINLDTLYYVVNFENDNGFVIASSDKREIPVFAYVEEGTYEDIDSIPDGQRPQVEENNGYLSFMCNLQELVINNRTLSHKDPNNYDLLIYDGNIIGGDMPPINPPETINEVQQPLLLTVWGQRDYNDYCNGYPTGCVITAVSQICSYLQKPNHVAWAQNGIGNQCSIDWQRINEECMNYCGNVLSFDLHDQIANLMRFWGLAFHAEYSEKGTGADSEDAIETLCDYGFNVSPLKDFDATDVINELRKGNRIIYMKGSERYYHTFFVIRQYVGGHAWVVDGYIHQECRGRKTDYLHCNWGWKGDKNGYFLAGVFDTDSPAFDDSYVTRGENYKYNLKYSTICK